MHRHVEYLSSNKGRSTDCFVYLIYNFHNRVRLRVIQFPLIKLHLKVLMMTTVIMARVG